MTEAQRFNTSPHPALMGARPIDFGPDDMGDPGLVGFDASQFREETIHWLEPGRIAMGKLNMIAGDPGLGKSFMTMELVARASRGEIGKQGAMSVILSAEDGPGDTIIPRLRAMCANLSKVHILTGIRREGGGCLDMPTLDRDMERLERLIEDKFPVSLVIIDPISAYMGKADSNNNAEVRGVLAMLSGLAERTGAAIVCVSHLNKDTTGKKAVYRTMGSLAFTAAARTVQLVTKYETTPGHHDEHAKDKRVVSMVKNNLCESLPARVFVLRNGLCTWLDEEVDIDADQFASGRVSFDARETMGDQACEFLERIMSAGEQPAKEVLERGAAMGLNEPTLRKAKGEMGLVSCKRGSVWYWAREGHEDVREQVRDAIENDTPPMEFGAFGTF